MALTEVKVPQLSESVAEATMLTWKKKAGDLVTADEILIEIETDKVVLEVPAPSSGVLSEILVGDGATVVAEQLIARIDTDGKVGATAAVPAAASAHAPAAAAQSVAVPATTSNSMAGVAMPSAAKMLADNGLAAGSVSGTGKDGRITKGDVIGVVASGVTNATNVIAPQAANMPATGLNANKSLPPVAAKALDLEIVLSSAFR